MWTYDDEFSFLFLNLNEILKNSTSAKSRLHFFDTLNRSKDMINFETQIHFFYRRFHCRRRRPYLRSLMIQHSDEQPVIHISSHTLENSFIWHWRLYLGLNFPQATKTEETSVTLCKVCQEASSHNRIVLECDNLFAETCTSSQPRSMKSPQIPWRQVRFPPPSFDPNILLHLK